MSVRKPRGRSAAEGSGSAARPGSRQVSAMKAVDEDGDGVVGDDVNYRVSSGYPFG